MSNKLKKYQEVLAKFWNDASFKEKLLINPKESLVEIGIEVPDNITIHVHENTNDQFHFVIPSKPGNSQDEQFNLNIEKSSTPEGGYTYFTYYGDSPFFNYLHMKPSNY